MSDTINELPHGIIWISYFLSLLLGFVCLFKQFFERTVPAFSLCQVGKRIKLLRFEMNPHAVADNLLLFFVKNEQGANPN